MADTPKAGETATPEEPKTTVTTSNPAQDNASQAEVERLRKEAEQAQMRANQLQNELEQKKKAEEEAERKRLEEKEEWKTVAEQEKAKREALEQEREAATRQEELTKTTNQVFSDFPDEVVELAKETGLALTDTSDEAKELLKQKLEKIQSRVVSKDKVTPNNPSAPTSSATRQEQMQRMRAGDRQAREQVISNIPAVQAMRKMAGLSE